MYIKLFYSLLLAITFSMQVFGQPMPQIQLIAERMKVDFLSSVPDSSTVEMPVNGSWPDINYKALSTSTWVAGKHWDRLIVLAKKYIQKDINPKDGEILLKTIVSAIDFWDKERPVCSNYWWNAIGVPIRMGQVLVLLKGELPHSSVAKVIAFMQLGIKPTHYEYYGAATGQNQVWLAQVHAMIGVVTNDTAAMRRAFNAFHNEVFLSTGEGIQYDYSFFQHGHQLYSGGYGIGYTQDIARLIRLAHGTVYQFPNERIDIFSNFLLEGQRWMTYRGVFDYSTTGREISRYKNADGRVLAIAEVCETLATLNIPKREALLAMAEKLRNQLSSTVIGNRHFWRGDLMVHHAPKFYTSIKMASSRIKSSEWGNRENEKSFYLGNGVQFIMRDGTEYKQIFPVWNWQRLPGSLAEQRDTIPKTSGPWGDGAWGKKPFTGGVSNGSIGLAANDYALEFITARRAWFCLQNEVVVMGAAICNNSQNLLFQTINQSHAKGAVWVQGKKQKSPFKASDDQILTMENTAWVWHDSTAYFFPEANHVTVGTKKQAGSWKSINEGTDSPTDTISKNVFSAWIDFGAQVRDSSFVYAIVPGLSQQQAVDYKLAFDVIKNTKDIQAIWHKNEHAVMAAFYNAGSIYFNKKQWWVSINKPALLIIKQSANVLELSISNPLNKGGTVLLQVNKKLSGKGCVWNSKTKLTDVTLELPADEYAGQSITTSFQILN